MVIAHDFSHAQGKCIIRQTCHTISKRALVWPSLVLKLETAVKRAAEYQFNTLVNLVSPIRK